MDITYGKGARQTPAAVLNLFNGDIYSLDGVTSPPQSSSNLLGDMSDPTARMFAYLNGEQLTSTKDGGTGFVPDHEGFLQCGVLNTGIKRPEIPVEAYLPDGRRIIVTSSKGKVDSTSHVILVHDSKTISEVFVVPNRATAIYRAITSAASLRTGPRIQRTIRSYAPWDQEGQMTCKEKEVVVYGASGKIGMLNLPRILDLVFWRDMYYPGKFGTRRLHPWHQGLGVAIGVDGSLYFNTAGILRAKVNPAKKLSQQIPWVTFITDPRPGFNEHDLYIVERQGKPTLTARYKLRAGKGGQRYVVNITPIDAADMRKSRMLLPKYVETLLPPSATV